MMRYIILFIVLIASLASFGAVADEENDPFRYEKNEFKLRVIAQGPEQMSGFYEGRGFSRQAIDEISKACFITVLMTNNSKKVVWLDISRWRIYTGTKPVERYTRQHWKTKFEALNIPLGHQSTFGWTLLPEMRDLHPNEPVGGNITMVRQTDGFTMEMRFQTGANKKGKEFVVKFDQVKCKQ